MNKYLLGLIQCDTQRDTKENLAFICNEIDKLAKSGCAFIVTPEMMNSYGDTLSSGRETLPGYTSNIMCQKAKEHGIWLLLGSLATIIEGEERCYNTSVLISPEGEIKETYNKIHTFDVVLPDGSVINESDEIKGGDEIKCVKTPVGCLGLSICYDVRFPELYRKLSLNGAEILLIPANFSYQTGIDHWEVLLRARAIENGCFVIGVTQCGTRPDGFKSYGHSMVINPWGCVIVSAKEDRCSLKCEIDLDQVNFARNKIPSLKNRRPDVYEKKVVLS